MIHRNLILTSVVCLILTEPAASQATKTMDRLNLSCGQNILIDDQSCRSGEILQITGSCLDPRLDEKHRGKGMQYNCIKKSQKRKRAVR